MFGRNVTHGPIIDPAIIVRDGNPVVCSSCEEGPVIRDSGEGEHMIVVAERERQ